MRILVIRRDNIGDLVCTTPLLAMLRKAQPQAEIAVLANSYNAPVLRGNPDVSKVYAYTKLKHRGSVSALATLGRSAKLYLDLRAARFDWAILAGGNCTPQMLAAGRRSGAKQLIAYRPRDDADARRIDVCLDPAKEPRHEVLDTAALGAPLGASGEPGPLRVFASPRDAGKTSLPIIAVSLGARDDKRWPGERFAALCDGLRRRFSEAQILLLWPPAEALAATRSDDAVVAEALLAGGPPRTVGRATARLEDLIDGLASASLVISVDGGAVHLAAALGKPVVGLYANRPEVYKRWYPWKVPNRVVVSPRAKVAEIDPDAALEATVELARETDLALG
jgi:heptosyltransferase-3